MLSPLNPFRVASFVLKNANKVGLTMFVVNNLKRVIEERNQAAFRKQLRMPEMPPFSNRPNAQVPNQIQPQAPRPARIVSVKWD